MMVANSPSVRRAIARGVRVVLFVAVLPFALRAQSSIGDFRRTATRGELEKAVTSLESAALKAPDEKTRRQFQADAAALRQRLTNGDFVPGDRILLTVLGDSALTDTFTVRGDRRLPLPNIDDISLSGVLDSELEPFLRRELRRYLKPIPPDTTLILTATPLVRLLVQGAIPQPNFYTVPVDQAIPDLIALAGGTGGLQTAFDKTVVRRAGKVFIESAAFRDAWQQGKTVGDLSLRDGDEIFIPDKASTTFNWQGTLAVVSTLAGVYFLVRYGFSGRRP